MVEDGLCYGGGQFQGEWSCYKGGQFNRENGHVTEVVSLIEGDDHVNLVSSMEEE